MPPKNSFDAPPEWGLVPKDDELATGSTLEEISLTSLTSLDAVPLEREVEFGDLNYRTLDGANEIGGTQQEHVEQSPSPESGQERLNESMERLNANLKKLDALPSDIISSPEGKKETETFLENISSRLKNFGIGVKEKIRAAAASLDNGDRVGATLATVAGVGMLAPVMMQFIRSRWPEAGVAMDMMPDALQQLAHLDLASKVADLLGGTGQMWVWDTNNVEGMNLLSDVASGRFDFASLAPEQLELLQQTLPTNSMSMIEHFAHHPTENISAQTAALTEANLSAAVPMFGNIALLPAPALIIGVALTKIGKIARQALNKK